MKLAEAISKEISDMRKPVITGYDLGRLLFAVYKAGNHKGTSISHLRTTLPSRQNYSSVVKALSSYSVVRHGKFVSHKYAFEIFSASSVAPSPGEVACCVDPFAYVSHLSAMEYHGLTGQFPKMLFMSSPKSKLWAQLAKEQMEKDLGEDLKAYLDAELPTLKRLMVNKIAGKPVNVYSSGHYDYGAYVTVKDKVLKVSSIGRTFLDMIRSPDLCGGIYHVLEVYSEHAKRYLRLIVDETDQNGSLIDKTRVGYILDERLGLSEPRIERWKKNVQRGGSRKLVADGDYSPTFSETWCLSINIEESLEQ
jgi:predicted transcriptional regulator of viral defense system